MQRLNMYSVWYYSLLKYSCMRDHFVCVCVCKLMLIQEQDWYFDMHPMEYRIKVNLNLAMEMYLITYPHYQNQQNRIIKKYCLNILFVYKDPCTYSFPALAHDWLQRVKCERFDAIRWRLSLLTILVITV